MEYNGLLPVHRSVVSGQWSVPTQPPNHLVGINPAVFPLPQAVELLLYFAVAAQDFDDPQAQHEFVKFLLHDASLCPLPESGKGKFFEKRKSLFPQLPVRAHPLHLSTRAFPTAPPTTRAFPSRHGPACAFFFCLRCSSIGAYNEAERVTQLGG